MTQTCKQQMSRINYKGICGTKAKMSSSIALPCSPKMFANIIMPLYVITVAVTTRRSGFYGHAEKKLLQQVISDPEARELLERVGKSLEL